MVIKSDDGKLLEVKEGVVLDSNGEPLLSSSDDTSGYAKKFGEGLHVFKLKGWPLLLVLPIGIIVGLMALLIALFFMVFRVFFSRKSIFQQRV